MNITDKGMHITEEEMNRAMKKYQKAKKKGELGVSVDVKTACALIAARFKKKDENSAPKPFVPKEFMDEDIEFFFHELEKESVLFEGKETKLLDRTSLPWVFVSKKIAAYVTRILRDDYSLYFAAARMANVTGYTGDSLRDLYRKMKASEEWPIGADVVDKALKRCNRHRLNKV